MELPPAEKPYARKELIDWTIKRHRELGGEDSKSTPSQQIKKVLGDMVKRGHYVSDGDGFYRKQTDAKPLPTDDEFLAQHVRPPLKPPEPVPPTPAPAIAAPEVEIGSGSNAVYGWYYPAYKELAELKGHSTWPIKVGLSDADARTRMVDSRGYAPEQSVLAFVHNINDSAACEKIYHGQLEVLGRKVGDSVGKEWFNTNLDELRELAEHIEVQLSKNGDKS